MPPLRAPSPSLHPLTHPSLSQAFCDYQLVGLNPLRSGLPMLSDSRPLPSGTRGQHTLWEGRGSAVSFD